MSTPEQIFPGDDQKADEAAIRAEYYRAAGGLRALSGAERSVEAAVSDAERALADSGAPYEEQALEEKRAIRTAMRAPLGLRRRQVLTGYYQRVASHFQERYGLRIDITRLGDEWLEYGGLEGAFEGYVQRVTGHADLASGNRPGVAIGSVALDGTGLAQIAQHDPCPDDEDAPEWPDPEGYLVPVSEMELRVHRAIGEVRPRTAAVRQLIERAALIRSRYGKTWADFEGCFNRTYGRSHSPDERFMAPGAWLPEVGRMVGQFVRVREAAREDRGVEPTALPVPAWADRRRYELGTEELPARGDTPRGAAPRSVTGFSVYKNGKCRIHFPDEVELAAFADYYKS